jgi:trk system potassium uptake protein TrkH
MRFHVVLRYVALALLLNAIFMGISCIISAFNTDTALMPLLYSSLIITLFGLFPLIFVPPTMHITNKEGLLIVVLSWLLSCLAGTLPYILFGGPFSFTNAWFESVSGFTTTGSTILVKRSKY